MEMQAFPQSLCFTKERMKCVCAHSSLGVQTLVSLSPPSPYGIHIAHSHLLLPMVPRLSPCCPILPCAPHHKMCSPDISGHASPHPFCLHSPFWQVLQLYGSYFPRRRLFQMLQVLPSCSIYLESKVNMAELDLIIFLVVLVLTPNSQCVIFQLPLMSATYFKEHENR